VKISLLHSILSRHVDGEERIGGSEDLHDSYATRVWVVQFQGGFECVTFVTSHQTHVTTRVTRWDLYPNEWLDVVPVVDTGPSDLREGSVKDLLKTIG